MNFALSNMYTLFVYNLKQLNFSECDPPSVDPDVSYDPLPIANKYNHDQTVTLKCDTSTHTAEGTSKYTCNNGNFDNVKFQCHTSK